MLRGSGYDPHKMIYCVVPEALVPEMYDKLVRYYDEDENVTVIVDRRKAERRDGAAPVGGMRELRDRRRRRPGELPPLVSGQA
jgi:hypothetical protein